MHGAAVSTGVQVDGRQLDVDLGVHQPAEPDRDRGHVALEEPRVADDHGIRAEAVTVLGDPRLQAHGPVLLLALEHEREVDRGRPPDRAQRLERGEVHDELPLVVGDAAADEPAIADEGLERGVLPQVERVDGLHVVMAVDDGRRRARRLVDPAVDDRVEVGAMTSTSVAPEPAEPVRDPLGRRDHVRRVLVQGRDAGDARDLEERLDPRARASPPGPPRRPDRSGGRQGRARVGHEGSCDPREGPIVARRARIRQTCTVPTKGGPWVRPSGVSLGRRSGRLGRRVRHRRRRAARGAAIGAGGDRRGDARLARRLGRQVLEQLLEALACRRSPRRSASPPARSSRSR